MTHPVHYFVPVLTSEAGLSLTTANWQEANVTHASYHLDALLVKPGLKALHNVPDLARYLNWPATLILNASMLVVNREGNITVTSPFDGSKVRFTCSELLSLINHLKPTIVLLPAKFTRHVPELWAQWDRAIVPYFAFEELEQQAIRVPHGVYLHSDDVLKNLNELQGIAELPLYLNGVKAVSKRFELTNSFIYLEADAPAASAYNGLVIDEHGQYLDLKNVTVAQHFEVIDPDCSCITCEQKLTKAYLHHLYHHTPLLCQRFLIQHNVHSAQYLLEK